MEEIKSWRVFPTDQVDHTLSLLVLPREQPTGQGRPCLPDQLIHLFPFLFRQRGHVAAIDLVNQKT